MTCLRQLSLAYFIVLGCRILGVIFDKYVHGNEDANENDDVFYVDGDTNVNQDEHVFYQQMANGPNTCLSNSTPFNNFRMRSIQAKFTAWLCCIITLVCIMMYKIASLFAAITCTVFYDLVVDPVSKLLSGPGFNEPSHQSHTPRGSGILGRHNNRRAMKRGGRGSSTLPFRASCVRRRNASRHSSRCITTRSRLINRHQIT